MFLKAIRLRKLLSQKELAEQSGVPQQVISDIESGKTNNPRFDTIKKLAQALGVSIDELMNE